MNRLPWRRRRWWAGRIGPALTLTFLVVGVEIVSLLGLNSFWSESSPSNVPLVLARLSGELAAGRSTVAQAFGVLNVLSAVHLWVEARTLRSAGNPWPCTGRGARLLVLGVIALLAVLQVLLWEFASSEAAAEWTVHRIDLR